MKKIVVLNLLVCLFWGCSEDIELNVIGEGSAIVVEGRIESGDYPWVTLTKSTPVSEELQLDSLAVLNADVYVSDGTITDTLELDLDPTKYALGFAYKGKTLIGMPGQSYDLTIKHNGNTYTSTTLIPTPIPLDSIWWKAAPKYDSLGSIWAFLTEPAGRGDAYRWEALIPGKDRRYLSPVGGTFDDKFIDGEGFELFFDRGVDAVSADPSEEIEDPDEQAKQGLFAITDTVYIKFSTIDNASERFYTTYETAYLNNGNPFASPTTVSTNIEGGAFGIWAGFGVSLDTIIPAVPAP